MSTMDFFLPEARRGVAQAVEEVEKQTTAEVVVAVRRRSGHYRHTDLYAGAVTAFLVLLGLLFGRREFAIEWMPVEIVGSFAFAATWVGSVDAVRRRLTSKRLMSDNVRIAARAAFYELGIARTRGRTGILVFVSMFERRVEVVPDIGVKPSELGPEWSAVVARLEETVGRSPDLGRFLAALRTMAPPLAHALPPRADDIDELPNEPLPS